MTVGTYVRNFELFASQPKQTQKPIDRLPDPLLVMNHDHDAPQSRNCVPRLPRGYRS
jgi:hypothetical protein